ncbi:hypothetical protein [Burkholderia pseudomallei]|uniref:hypothetical protein n=1 Tax=Burkholderia pseudomallei TaxID=28450 RepID=UPI000978B08A|nr:hypothetical protein [Burkholderia pseudomallei]OMS07805.1 hypothetical protein AQ736_03390 [Burkholderia pseudomallei]OMS96433.1 hypothetical protein AQ750_04670 [Burkholderia pseudomallei]OMV27160.1 hypothetical protein AQ787_14150 [Burkholderia pseudomallei]CAJ3486340.1 Uncharacterised protein [Burkholderia pseudomallei]CAJ4175582.1 Uncharacterised protein [Burkholderia pseudomallei]
MSKMLELFKVGEHRSSGGQTRYYSPERCRKIVETYNRKVAEGDQYKAPIVIGHPEKTDKAYGWIKSLSFDEGTGKILGEPEQVAPELVEMVAKGEYRRSSISFYGPGSSSGPVPAEDIEYPRHHGLFGAHPVSIKDLAPVSFSAADEGVLSYGEDESPLHRLKSWIASKFGKADADAVFPDEAVQAEAAQTDVQPTETAATVEPVATPAQPVAEPVVAAPVATAAAPSADFSEREAALEARAAEIAAKEAQLRAVKAESFCESLIEKGVMLPAAKADALALMSYLGSAESTINFAEGDEAPLEVFKRVATGMKKLVEYSEVAPASATAVEDPVSAVNFTVPKGHAVDPEQLAHFARLKAYAQKTGKTLAQVVSEQSQSQI